MRVLVRVRPVLLQAPGISVADVEAMSYRELQAACKAQGMRAKGKAAELREQLLAVSSAVEAEAPAAEAPSPLRRTRAFLILVSTTLTMICCPTRRMMQRI